MAASRICDITIPPSRFSGPCRPFPRRRPAASYIIREDEIPRIERLGPALTNAGEEGQRHQVCGDAKSQFDDPTIAHDSFALGKANLHVVMVKKRLVEWVYCLIYSLLGDEKQSSLIRVIAYSQPLLRRCDQVQQFRWQRFGRLDVYPHRAHITTQSDCCNRNTSIVGERADDPCGPGWRSPGSSR